MEQSPAYWLEGVVAVMESLFAQQVSEDTELAAAIQDSLNILRPHLTDADSRKTMRYAEALLLRLRGEEEQCIRIMKELEQEGELEKLYHIYHCLAMDAYEKGDTSGAKRNLEKLLEMEPEYKRASAFSLSLLTLRFALHEINRSAFERSWEEETEFSIYGMYHINFRKLAEMLEKNPGRTLKKIFAEERYLQDAEARILYHQLGHFNILTVSPQRTGEDELQVLAAQGNEHAAMFLKYLLDRQKWCKTVLMRLYRKEISTRFRANSH